MNQMKLLTVLALVLVAAAFAGCKYFRGQILDGPGMEREVDSLETDSVPLADDGKHTQSRQCLLFFTLSGTVVEGRGDGW